MSASRSAMVRECDMETDASRITVNAGFPLVARPLTRLNFCGPTPRNKKARRSAPFAFEYPAGSALGELERAPRLRLAVLLALDHAAVACQEAAALERAAQIRLEIGQRLGNAVTHCAGL